MSLKSRAYGLMMMAAMMGAGMSGPRSYEGPRRYVPKNYKPLPEYGEIPKGHKHEDIQFKFEWQGNLLSIMYRVTYGTAKSKIKHVNQISGELQNYIRNTPMEKILEFKQFEVLELPKQESIGVTKEAIKW